MIRCQKRNQLGMYGRPVKSPGCCELGFPRKMFALLGLLVVGGGAALFLINESDRRQADAREKELVQIVMRASGKRTACTNPC